MTQSSKSINPGDKPPAHEHIWGQWWAMSPRMKYRTCVVPNCGATQEKVVT